MKKSQIQKLKILNYNNIKKITLRLPKNITDNIEILSYLKNFSFNECYFGIIFHFYKD